MYYPYSRYFDSKLWRKKIKVVPCLKSLIRKESVWKNDFQHASTADVKFCLTSLAGIVSSYEGGLVVRNANWKLISITLCVQMSCLHLCAHSMCLVLLEMRRGHGSLGTGVTGGCELHVVWVLGIKASLLKSISAFNHWTNSPAPRKRAFSLGVKGAAIHLIFKGTKNPISGNENRVGRGAGWKKKRFLKDCKRFYCQERRAGRSQRA